MWQVAQKRPRLVAILNTPAQSLALSNDGQELAAALQDGRIQLWTTATSWRALPVENARGANGNTPSLQFSRDGKTLFGTNIRISKDNTTAVYAWNVPRGNVAWSVVSDYPDDMKGFTLAPDGSRLVHSTYDIVKVLDLAANSSPRKSTKSRYARRFPVLSRFRLQIPVGQGYTFASAFALTPDGSLIVAERNGRLGFWNIATTKKQSQTPAPPSNITGPLSELFASPDGRFVAFCDSYNLWLWNRAASTWTQHTSASSMGEKRDIAWMPDSRSLWVGGDSIQLLSAPALKIIREIPVSGAFALSGDGRTLATRSLSTGVVNGVWAWKVG